MDYCPTCKKMCETHLSPDMRRAVCSDCGEPIPEQDPTDDDYAHDAAIEED